MILPSGDQRGLSLQYLLSVMGIQGPPAVRIT